MIDKDGFRLNVGIVIVNADGKLFWGKRAGRLGGWQFPQGGVDANEPTKTGMFRELNEEVGLSPDDVEIIAESQDWYRYYLPKRFRRTHVKPLCVGQKQRWFLLRLLKGDDAFDLQAGDKPEFVEWRWVDYQYPSHNIILFKRQVYKDMLNEFEPYVAQMMAGLVDNSE